VDPLHSSLPIDTPQQAQARAALLAILADGRRAHFATDAELMVAHDAEHVLAVREGHISTTTRAETLARAAENFRGATYQEWDYVNEPIVRIADDGSIAWVISRVRVRRTVRLPDGAEEAEAFIYAGLDTFEPRDGAWVRTANVSTFAAAEA
jgi:hypothetical protein